MKIDILNKAMEKFCKPKLVNFILGKRVCPKCAKKVWKDEDKSQSFTELMGICEVCHKAGKVAYIEKD